MTGTQTWGAKSPVSLRQCPLCNTRGQVYKSGRLKHGPQRYICRSCGRTFQLESPRKTITPEDEQRIIELYTEGKSHAEITAKTGASSSKISAVTHAVRGKRTGKICPSCGSDEISRFGKSRNGLKQRFRCRHCLRTFNEPVTQSKGIPDMAEPASSSAGLAADTLSDARLFEVDGQLYEALPGSRFEDAGSIFVPVSPVAGRHSVQTFDAAFSTLAVAPDLRTAEAIAALAASHLGGYGCVIVRSTGDGVTHHDPLTWLTDLEGD